MASKTTYDVFLCYDRQDKPAVEELARRLMGKKLKPFFDVWDLVPGKFWLDTLEETLDQCRALAVFIGPSGLGPWQNEEMVRALRSKSLPLILVLLPGASMPEMPLFLTSTREVDFRGGLDDPHTFRRLVYGIKRISEHRLEEDLESLWDLVPETATAKRGSLSSVRLYRLKSWLTLKHKAKEVWLGAAAPPIVARNSKFVARFSAYTSAYRAQVHKIVETEAPGARKFFDLHSCQWEPGTKVYVALSSDHLHVAESPQSFAWNGKWAVLRFDVDVPGSLETTQTVLKFDVSIEGLIVARLRPELTISDSVKERDWNERPLTVARAPSKAFASYASTDRREVLGRIRSLQIFTGITVFLDCLSIHPGEQWKPRIEKEILQRDIFWLFWSRHARDSQWVEWEWRTALTVGSLDYIQPHPLESAEIAPPPPELAELQFGTLYESFLSQLRSSWWDRRVTQSRKIIRRIATSPGLVLLFVLLVVTLLWGFLR